MSNHNNNNKTLNIRLGSLNCRTLFKMSNEQLSDHLIQYLRLQRLDIFACQETNIVKHSFNDITTKLNFKFQSYQSIWSTKCGLINNNQNLNMESIKISDDDRFILAKFTVIGESNIPPFYILNLYAPASDFQQARNKFFIRLMEFLTSLDSYLDIMNNMVLLGDFNFSFEKQNGPQSHSRRPRSFMTFISTYFSDCINSNDDDDFYNMLPTFRRAQSISCIDYIFAGQQLQKQVHEGKIDFLSPRWTDHALLTSTISIGCSNTGKGL